MKLFKSLLVAPATLGLLAPMSATATELNLAEVSGYSSSEEVQNISEFSPKELAVTNSRVDGLEARINEFEAGTFSETTTASFSTDLILGGYDGGTTATDDPYMAVYSFQIDLNTTFTGEDSLDISLDAGNTTAGTTGVTEFDGNNTGDSVDVDGVKYTFPVGEKLTVFVGDNVDGSDLFTKACVYGGPGTTLSDCAGVSAYIGSGGPATGASYDFGNGFTAAVGYSASNGNEALGIMTEEQLDRWALNTAYTGDNFGISLAYGNIESTTDDLGVTLDDKEDTFTAINAYWIPDYAGFPSLSAGYEIGDDGSLDINEETVSYFLGATWSDVFSGELGIAMGTNTPTVESGQDALQYELYYSYALNDGMTITPMIFKVENHTVGTDDATGLMVKTSFSF